MSALLLCFLGEAAAKTFYDQVGSSASDFGYAVACSGEICVTGGYSNGNARSSINTGLTMTNAGSSDGFIISYNTTSGMPVFLQGFDTAFSDAVFGVAIDASRNVYSTGFTGGALNGQTALGSGDCFLTKHNSELLDLH
jgi:hypothetical protein